MGPLAHWWTAMLLGDTHAACLKASLSSVAALFFLAPSLADRTRHAHCLYMKMPFISHGFFVYSTLKL